MYRKETSISSNLECWEACQVAAQADDQGSNSMNELVPWIWKRKTRVAIM
jgi:hypothetical protein